MANNTGSLQVPKKSKLKEKYDVEVLYWFFGCEGDIVQSFLEESKPKNLTHLVELLRERF